MRFMANEGEGASRAGDYSVPVERLIPSEYAGRRLEQSLARLFPEHSRNRLAGWIRAGRVTVDAARAEVARKVWGGERIALVAERAPGERPYRAEAMALQIVDEDDWL